MTINLNAPNRILERFGIGSIHYNLPATELFSIGVNNTPLDKCSLEGDKNPARVSAGRFGGANGMRIPLRSVWTSPESGHLHKFWLIVYSKL